MPGFFIHLYTCFSHTSVCLYLVRPWLSGDCGCPITRGLAVQSPLTAQKKDWWADSWRRGSSAPFHTFVCLFFFIHLYACFFSYIGMPVFFHTVVCLFFHSFLHLYLGWPWRSGECGRPLTRGLVAPQR